MGQPKGWTAPLVRSYAACPSTEVPAANTETSWGTPACESVTPKTYEGQATDYLFAGNGSCTMRLSAKTLADCSSVRNDAGEPAGFPAEPCHLAGIKATCKGIRQAGGIDPIDAGEDAGWELFLVARLTINDPYEDMTTIDMPLTLSFGLPAGGGIQLDSNIAEAISAYASPAVSSLPVCSNVHILGATVRDPSGRPFAEMGNAPIDVYEYEQPATAGAAR